MKVPGGWVGRSKEATAPVGLWLFAACVALGVAACDGGASVAIWRAAPDARTYRVLVSLTAAAQADAARAVLPASFVVGLHASASAGRLLLWSAGITLAPPVAATGTTLTTTAPLSLGVAGWPEPLWIDVTSMSVDAKRDGVRGSFAGTAHLNDAGASPTELLMAVTGALTGDVDDTAPYLMGPATSDLLHPVDPVTFRSSLPLAPDVALELVAADGERIALASRPPPELAGPGAPGPGFVDRFQSTVTLRFAQRYHVEARTPIRDLTGRVAALTPLSAFTLAEPEVLLDGSFEGRAPGVFEYAWIRDFAPVIAGTRSLELGASAPWPTRFTARMPVPAGATQLTFAWRAVAGPWNTSPTVTGTSVSFTWPGATLTPTMLPPIDGAFAPLDQYNTGTPVTTATIPLPADVPDEVWVVIARSLATATDNGTDTPIQIDDLELQ